MNRNSMKTVIRLSIGMVALGWASLAVAARSQNTPHPCSVTVADRVGDAILSDGHGVYTDGIDAECRLWDMASVADHLYFVAPGGVPQSTRTLKLSIPGVTNGAEICGTGTLQPNQNSSNYQFYNLLAVGSSTNDVGQNFGGTFKCTSGINLWTITYESQCIVITHGQYGTPGSNIREWTITANGAPCTATVTKSQNRKVVGTWINQDVPFQVTATELP
ncbi:MAG: hypothetical protein ABJC07_05840 [Acidobacteriota bacterium]